MYSNFKHRRVCTAAVAGLTLALSLAAGGCSADTKSEDRSTGGDPDMSSDLGVLDSETVRPDLEPDECEDGDEDGYAAKTCGGTDCDDTDPTVHPGAETAIWEREGLGRRATLGMDAAGTLYAAYVSEAEDLYLARKVDNAWVPELVAADTTLCAEPEIAFDGESNVHLFVPRCDGGKALVLFTKSDQGWQETEFENLTYRESARGIDSATDANGDIHVAYHWQRDGYDIGMRYATNKDGSWQIEEVGDDVGQRAIKSSITTHDSVPFLTYSGNPGVFVAHKQSSWVAEELGGGSGNGDIGAAVAVESNGRLHVFKHHAASKYVHHHIKDGDSWSDRRLEKWTHQSERRPRFDLALTIDSSDRLHVVYEDHVPDEYERRVTYLTTSADGGEDAEWKAEVVLESSPSAPIGPRSVLVDPQGRVHTILESGEYLFRSGSEPTCP